MDVRKCELCGGEPKVRGRGVAMVRCTVCGVQGPTAIHREDAIREWNAMQDKIAKGGKYDSTMTQIGQIILESEDN